MDERVFKLVDTSTRVFLPMALESASMREAASALRTLPSLTVKNAQEVNDLVLKCWVV